MIKLVFFDLDGTLAPVGLPCPRRCAAALRKIRASGVRLAVCSGKPVAYLNGFARQIGIPDLVLCGENGLTFQLGVDLPPAVSGILGVRKSDLSALGTVAKGFKAEFGDKCWYQPNEYSFTPFPRKAEYFAPMREYLRAALKNTSLIIYEHPDCFDILPRGVDKGEALLNVCRLLGVNADECAAVGDHINDHPMFAAAGRSIGIKLEDASRADINTRSLNEALDLIIKEIKNNG